MSMTRRTLLRTVGSLSAAQAFSGLAFATPAPAPDPNSIYVLFGGPWLFYPTGDNMTAMSFGESGTGPFMHACQYGLGTPNDKNLKNPQPFNSGQTFAIQTTNAAHTGSFTDAFNTAFAQNPLLWIKGQSPFVTPRSYDRAVTLPLPSAIYVAGNLKTAAVTQGSQILHTPAVGLGPIRPYVVTILQYSRTGTSPVGLTLTIPGQPTPRTFVPNDHLIFRMTHRPMGHETPAEEAKHVKDAFDELMLRVTAAGGPVQIAPTDSCCTIGHDPGGFDQDQLGLDTTCTTKRKHKPRKPKHPQNNIIVFMSTYANCAGGGGPVGP